MSTNGVGLQVREDTKLGVYVDNLTTETVTSVADAQKVIRLLEQTCGVLQQL